MLLKLVLYGSSYLIHGTLQSFPYETYLVRITLTTLYSYERCETPRASLMPQFPGSLV